ncbi:MAG: molybdate ABC transporter substrate-binding protein [Neomegalonema sp.]|nr:molybdate ABC transporter substrate-binding protein [Neomegalonema sp.]
MRRPPFAIAAIRSLLLGAGLFAGIALCLPGFGRAQAEEITVFAAASLMDALKEVGADFERDSGHEITFSFAGSSALARQIEFGAPVDVFISANAAWMDALQERGLIDRASRFDLIGNTLVLISHRADASPVALGPELDLAGLLNGGVLAMGLVAAVPAGIYAKEALQALTLWEQVAGQIAQSDNVRAALALVASGEAPLGIVYASDARASPAVHVLATFPAHSHTPIRYPAARIAGSDTPASAALLAYLRSPEAQAVFERHGFAALSR